jgi:hypothetical protein
MENQTKFDNSIPTNVDDTCREYFAICENGREVNKKTIFDCLFRDNPGLRNLAPLDDDGNPWM